MTEAAPPNNQTPGVWTTNRKILLLWAIASSMAVGTLWSLGRYQAEIVRYIAYTDASPARKSAFLEEQADRIFEALIGSKTDADGDVALLAAGSLKGNSDAARALELYDESLKAMGGLSRSPATHEKMAALYSYMGEEDLRAQAQARAFLDRRDYPAAADAASDCVSVNGRVLLAEALLGAGDDAQAREVAAALKKEDSENPDVLYLLADIAKLDNRPKERVKLLEQVIKARPRQVGLYVELSIQYQTMGELDQARFALGRAVEVEPNDPSLYHRLGLVQYEAGRYRESADSLKKAVDILDGHAPLWLDLRRAYLKLGEEAQAKMALQRALAIDASLVDKRLGE